MGQLLGCMVGIRYKLYHDLHESGHGVRGGHLMIEGVAHGSERGRNWKVAEEVGNFIEVLCGDAGVDLNFLSDGFRFNGRLLRKEG